MSAQASLLKEIRTSPALWFLILTPVVIVYSAVKPTAHTALFLLSAAAIVPLAILLSRATEAVAAKTGDTIGGLLNATLGNLTELVIAITALKAGQIVLVKASMAGAILTNALFTLGAALFLGGLKYPEQEFNKASTRLQGAMMFMASVALMVPSAISSTGMSADAVFVQNVSVALSVILLLTYGASLLFSLKTHKALFAAHKGDHEEDQEPFWPFTVGIVVLAVVTICIAFVSEIF